MHQPPPPTGPARSRFEASFRELLVTWNHHQDLRRSRPSIAQLASSRADLDRLRLQTARHREQLAA